MGAPLTALVGALVGAPLGVPLEAPGAPAGVPAGPQGPRPPQVLGGPPFLGAPQDLCGPVLEGPPLFGGPPEGPHQVVANARDEAVVDKGPRSKRLQQQQRQQTYCCWAGGPWEPQQPRRKQLAQRSFGEKGRWGAPQGVFLGLGPPGGPLQGPPGGPLEGAPQGLRGS